MSSLCVCATQWHTNATRMRSRDCIELHCAPHFDVSPLTYPPRHRPTRQGASPPPHSHPQIRQHETAANKPGTSCGIFSTSSPPTSSTALTRYTGAHTWERACRLPSSTAGGRAFVRSCACTVSFVMRHGGRPGRQRIKDNDGGDKFWVCGVQPIPRPVVCTALSRATAPPPPSTRHCRCPLHATPAAPMCHRQSHHWPLPLCAVPRLSMAFVHAPCAAWAPWGTHCHRTCLTRVHTSHMGPRATPLRPPCLGPVPGPIRGGRAPRSAPIACALASQAPSTAVPHISAPVACALASWAPSVAMRRNHVTMFVSRSCATGWHTCVGRAWETVHTL